MNSVWFHTAFTFCFHEEVNEYGDVNSHAYENRTKWQRGIVETIALLITGDLIFLEISRMSEMHQNLWSS